MTSGVYVRDLTYGEGWFQRGHWSDRLAAIDQDLALMQQKATAPPPVAADLAPGRAAALIQEILGQPQRPAHNVTHVPPASFRRGQPVAVTLTMADAPSPPPAVRLYYRHTQQAEPWCEAPMSLSPGAYGTAIPGAYSDSAYPLEYYFEISAGSGRPWLYPGFNSTRSNQPYFVLRQGQAPS